MSDSISLSERELRALRLFRSVVDAGGLTAAERKVGLERSTLSRQIKALEDRLGAAICLRGPRGFDLTDFGRDVLVAAVTLDDALGEVNRSLSLAKSTIRGELKVGIADNCITNPESHIVETLAGFTDTAPAVDLSVVIGSPEDLLRALHEFRVNCCVIGTRPWDSSLAVEPMFFEEFRLYVRGDVHPMPRFEDLRDRGFGLVIQKEPDPVPEILRTSDWQRVVNADGLEATALLIATGRFVGQLPTHYASALATVVPLSVVPGAERASVKVRFSFVSRTSRTPSRAQEHLRKLMLQAHHGKPFNARRNRGGQAKSVGATRR